MPVTPNSIITPQAIRTASAVCTAAKTTLSDGTNAVALFTAGPSGSVLYGLKALPRGTVSATQLQLYRHDGSTYALAGLTVMGAHPWTNTSAPAAADFGFTETHPLRVEAGESLYVGAAVALAAGIVFDAQYEDL